MKKATARKKLSLTRTTVRQLRREELRRVNGGDDRDGITESCTACTSNNVGA